MSSYARHTKQQLKAVITEHEASKQKMQASNEELRSINVVKHAGVDRALVAIGAEEEHVVVRVSDEGRGFALKEIEAQGQDEKAFELYSVRERLGLFDGRMAIDATPGEGTRVTLRMPVRSDAEAASAAGERSSF